eukprot:TRINITY_DN29161_c0_g4_i1.p1 TRINITY_DN29161_c0_g4~~TRINITY_DN29161_c0_g4_i1.p1  ORF type:complete len:178 (+),score=6.82 TRINITY_DN29161_c0_g4_i1:58-534(+)
MANGAILRGWRSTVDGKMATSCPLERAIAETFQELLPPPPPCLGVEDLVAVGVRDVAKLKQMRASGCEKCSAYKSIAAGGHCSRRSREGDPQEEPREAASTSPFRSQVDRPIQHRRVELEVPQARCVPVATSVAQLRPPADPKPEKARPRLASNGSKR